MIVFKCKMCGGALEIEKGSSIAECSFCGTKQTLPKLTSEKIQNLYDRANHFRRNFEYDKAMAIYEQILNEDATDAEAYWSIVLCSYGIVYVEDPKTKKRVPTINRMQYNSILSDQNYKKALELANEEQLVIYKEDAQKISIIQKNITEISSKEQPYDVFICYKETDSEGKRTHDSVIAQELYDGLTDEGYKVFFSRITLEDKLGTDYEPYIFAALNSAKAMVVLGTKPEHFNAVWVKNEWSRYLSLIKSGAKKVLIPAYKEMDAYDLPEEFSHLQAQNMEKLGFMQDLIRGIKKIVGGESKKAESKVNSNSSNVATSLKRVKMLLEEKNWARAKEITEKVLDEDPENCQAFIYRLMLYYQVSKLEEIYNSNIVVTTRNEYKQALMYANSEEKQMLENLAQEQAKKIKERTDAAEKKRQNDERLAKEKRAAEEAAKAAQEAANKAERKKERKKKTLKATIIIIIICALLAAPLINCWPGISQGMWFFPDILGDWKLYVMSCGKNVEVAEVPTTFLFIKVKGIDEGVFSNKPKLKKVIIPKEIKYIYPDAFENSPNLTEVVFEDPYGWYYVDGHSWENCETYGSVTGLDNPVTALQVLKNTKYGLKQVN